MLNGGNVKSTSFILFCLFEAFVSFYVKHAKQLFFQKFVDCQRERECAANFMHERTGILFPVHNSYVLIYILPADNGSTYRGFCAFVE